MKKNKKDLNKNKKYNKLIYYYNLKMQMPLIISPKRKKKQILSKKTIKKSNDNRYLNDFFLILL